MWAVARYEDPSAGSSPEVRSGAECLYGVYAVQCGFGAGVEDAAEVGEWEVGCHV